METKNYKLQFVGNGFELFKIQIVNLILSLVTLGLYYPWARAKTLQYLYSQTFFEEQPFVFTGTGNQIFRGFIKAIAFFILAFAMVIVFSYYGYDHFGILIFYAIIILIIPYVLHGAYKYRMAKTVWSSIRFGYVGDRQELTKIFYRGIFLTVITLGIYSAWLTINLRKYIVSNIKFGDAKFSYYAEGSDYFWLNVKGYVLTLLTLGIYSFWWQRELFDFYVNKLSIERNGAYVQCKSKATGGGFFVLTLVNFFIFVLTLGLGYPWVIIRTLNYVFSCVDLEGTISFEELQQASADFDDSTGEGFSDVFDFGFII